MSLNLYFMLSKSLYFYVMCWDNSSGFLDCEFDLQLYTFHFSAHLLSFHFFPNLAIKFLTFFFLKSVSLHISLKPFVMLILNVCPAFSIKSDSSDIVSHWLNLVNLFRVVTMQRTQGKDFLIISCSDCQNISQVCRQSWAVSNPGVEREINQRCSLWLCLGRILAASNPTSSFLPTAFCFLLSGTSSHCSKW